MLFSPHAPGKEEGRPAVRSEPIGILHTDADPPRGPGPASEAEGPHPAEGFLVLDDTLPLLGGIRWKELLLEGSQVVVGHEGKRFGGQDEFVRQILQDIVQFPQLGDAVA